MSLYNQHPEIHARLEVIQRQVSRLVALGIISSFFIFMTGYYAGKKYTTEESHASFSSDSFTEMVYGAFRSMQEAFTPYSEMGVTRYALALYDEKIHKEAKESDVQSTCYAVVAQCGLQKEADALCSRLKEAGFEASAHTLKSETPKGELYEWYQVRVYQDRIEEEFIKAIQAVGCKYRLKKIRIQNSDEADNQYIKKG